MDARIETFSPGLEPQLVELILPIQQREFGVPITLEDQPDLLAIPAFYQRGRGGFWVGLREDRVVGSIGLVDFGEGGAIRKMFVRADQRGTGLAQGLMDTLLAHARAAGLPGLWLGTLGNMRAAHRFYERNGFRAVKPDALPAGFPRVAVDTVFYGLELE